MHLVVSYLIFAYYITSTCLLYHAIVIHVVLEHNMFYQGLCYMIRYYTSVKHDLLHHVFFAKNKLKNNADILYYVIVKNAGY